MTDATNKGRRTVSWTQIVTISINIQSFETLQSTLWRLLLGPGSLRAYSVEGNFFYLEPLKYRQFSIFKIYEPPYTLEVSFSNFPFYPIIS